MYREITPEEYDAFGRIAHMWALAEFHMITVIATLTKMEDHHAQMIFWKEPFPSKKSLLIALMDVAPGMTKETKLRAKQILGEIGSKYELRNAVCHAPWTEGTEAGTITPRLMKIERGFLRFSQNPDSDRNIPTRDYSANDLHLEADHVLKWLREWLLFSHDKLGLPTVAETEAEIGDMERDRAHQGSL